MRTIQILILLLGNLYYLVNSESKSQSYERLHNDIMSRPVAAHKIPPDLDNDFSSRYRLTFYLRVLDIYDLDEIKQVIITNVYIEFTWTQAELAWNASDYNGLDWLSMDTNSLWTPSIAVLGGQEDSHNLVPENPVRLISDGMVSSSRQYQLTFGCEIDFDRYPFDSQTCTVGFWPRDDLPQPEIVINEPESPIMPGRFHKNGEWSLLNLTSIIERNGDGEAEYPSYTFVVQREPVYYIITFIFPMMLTSVMITLVFLIPAYTGEKISYLVAIYTSTAIYLNYISDVMPRSLAQMPHLALLLIEVLVEGFLAILASLFVVSHYYKEELVKQNQSQGNNSSVSTTEDGNMNSIIRVSHEDQDIKKDLASEPAGTIIKASGFSLRSLQKLPTCQLDFAIFIIFISGQTVFYIILFGFSGWL